MDKSTGDISALTLWTQREYEDALASRQAYDVLLDTCTRQYEQIPKQPDDEVDDPWPGASNLEVPEAASHCDAVYSRIEEAWFATDPWAKVNYFESRDQDRASALQDFLNQVTLPNAGYRSETPHVILAMTKLGTAFQWCSFWREYRTIKRNGRLIKQPTHVGPLHRYISPRNVIFPPDIRDVQKGRWIATRNFYTWGEMQHLKNLGIFDDISNVSQRGRIIGATRGSLNASREGERESGISRSGTLLQWEVVEMYARYFNERSNDLEEIWITFDYPSMAILNVRYAEFDHLERPLTRYTYMIREGAFCGLGIVGMLSMIQEEITTIHNYVLDAMYASNAPMISGPKNQQEQIIVHPGAYLAKTHPNDKFEVFQMGMVHQSAYQSEANARAIGERRTGIGDASMQRLGALQGGTNIRTPVGTTMALLGESNRRFAMSISLNKEAEKGLLTQHVMLLKQYWPEMRSIAQQWNSRKADLIEQLFQLPVNVFTQRVGVELSMSTAALNKDVEKQNLAIISNYMREYYNFIIQLKQLLIQMPQLEREVAQALKGANELVQMTLRAYDVRNPDEILISLEEDNAQAGSAGGLTDELISQFLSGGATGGTEQPIATGAEPATRPPSAGDFTGTP